VFYRVTATLLIDENFPLPAIMGMLSALTNHCVVVNPGQPNQECSQVQTQLCYHDESPHQSCTVIATWVDPDCPSAAP